MEDETEVFYESDDNACSILIDDAGVDLCIAEDGDGFEKVEAVLTFEQFAALVKTIRRVPHDVMRKVGAR